MRPLLPALLLASAFAGTAAHAQQPAPAAPSATTGSSAAPNANAKRDELKSLQEQMRRAEEARAAVAKEIEDIAGERSRLKQALLDAGAKARTLDGRLADSERRLAELAEAERNLKASLATRHGVLAQVLAALQRLGRQPPPVLLVRPEAALDSIRSALVLDAVVGELRVEAEALVSDLGELGRLRAQIVEENQRIPEDVAALAAERTRLESLSAERQKLQNAREQDLAAEQQRTSELGRQAKTLEGLIGSMERDVGAARRAAASARNAPGAPRNLAALQDPARLTPAIAFSEAKGLLPLPVAGQPLRTFGAADGYGGSEHGASIATRAGAQVTAPCDGWVVYSGPFRSYGQLLILNAGGGYHILLAGMERIDVELGQFVLTGEPVASMGGSATASAAGTSGPPQPVLYVEFRKDGTSIDPAPWWSDTAAEKVGG